MSEDIGRGIMAKRGEENRTAHINPRLVSGWDTQYVQATGSQNINVGCGGPGRIALLAEVDAASPSIHSPGAAVGRSPLGIDEELAVALERPPVQVAEVHSKGWNCDLHR